MDKVFTPERAKKFYDRFGSKQDLQSFYELPALKELIAHGDFEHAHAVFEFGFGTGRLADLLLTSHLPKTASYSGIDISNTMAELANRRLRIWGRRVELRIFDGTRRLEIPDKSFDRFISTYVLDLFTPADIRSVLTEARRILKPGGLLCNLSLTRGWSLPTRTVIGIWRTLNRMNPVLTGGCRPISLSDYIGSVDWQVTYRNVISTLGIPSEVLIAKTRDN